ncbi:MAG: hypothetical protein RR778_15255 [Glutamicibacter sp.]|uniref:hypothetical protein n=1 Tax=Glutamicibacter sp. TaxID=1931995 RepID=UPI002FC6B84D
MAYTTFAEVKRRRRERKQRRPEQKWRGFIIVFSLLAAAWWIFMGLLSLEYGFTGPVCERASCFAEQLIVHYGGLESLVKFRTAMCFLFAVIFFAVAITRGVQTASPRKRKRKRGQ